jgi:hypothetical protein
VALRAGFEVLLGVGEKRQIREALTQLIEDSRTPRTRRTWMTLRQGLLSSVDSEEELRRILVDDLEGNY